MKRGNVYNVDNTKHLNQFGGRMPIKINKRLHNLITVADGMPFQTKLFVMLSFGPKGP